MIRRTILALTALACALPAQAGSDLLYTYRPVELASLKGYHNQPYWVVLAQCAGVHGALVHRYEGAGRAIDHQSAKARGVQFARLAIQRIRADRGVSEEEARRLVAAEADVGRDAGRVLLSKRPESGYSHEQLIDVLCTQVGERHERAARGRR
jgi:hypothetical protein